jgi:hypothetical protein
MRGRSLIERFDLAPCFTVTDGVASAGCWIVRCRHCSAGWLPSHTARSLANLIEHARDRHGITIVRRPRVERTIERRIVIAIDGHIIKTILDHVSVARADYERGGAVTIDCTYAPAPPVLTAGPAASPATLAAAAAADRWAADVEAWRRTL